MSAARARALLRWLLTATFAAGAASKLFFLDEFAGIVASYGLVPAAAVPAAAALVVAAELAVAASLAAGIRIDLGAAASALLLIGFSAAAAQAAMAGRAIDCGCFPGLLQQSIGLPFFARNALLLAMAATLFRIERNRLQEVYP